MSVANPPGRAGKPAARAGTWGPILLAGSIALIVLLVVLAVRLFDGDNPSTPRSALATLATALRDGDVEGMQGASCDGWPDAAADLAALGTIDQTFVLDGPTVDGGSGQATIGIGDDDPRTSPSPTTSAEALALEADFEAVVHLSFVDDRWCVASFEATPAG